MRKCIICGKDLKDEKGSVCDSCWNKFKVTKIEPVKQTPFLKTEDSQVEKLVIEIEKLGGKLELVDSFRPQVNERLNRVSEEIGDLRRMILDREKSQREIELNIDKFKEIMEEVSPEKFAMKIEKLNLEVDKSFAKIERNEKVFGSVDNELKSIRGSFEKIKSLENLVELSNKIKEDIDSIEHTKRYNERIAAKIESIFMEVNNKTADLTKNLSTIEKVDELTQELVKQQDGLNLKFNEDVIKKTDLDKFKNQLVQEVKNIGIKELPKEISEKLKELEESLKSLEKYKLQNESQKKELSGSFDEIKLEISKLTKGISKKITNLEQALEEKSNDLDRKVEEKMEILSRSMEGPEELEGEKRNILKLLKKAREDFETGSISERAYLELERANKSRIENINAILERLNKEIMYKTIKSVENQTNLLNEKISDVITKEDVGKITRKLKEFKERLDETKEIGERQKPIESSLKILSTRLGDFEKEYSKIKENIRQFKSVERKMEELNDSEKGFNRVLENYKSELTKKGLIDVQIDTKINNLAGKLFLLEQSQQELKDGLVALKDYNSSLGKKFEFEIKQVNESKANMQDLKELNLFLERALRKNAEVVESMLDKMGI